MAFNPFRPLAEDQLKRVQPYAAEVPNHPGFEGVREITSDESEDFKDLLTFNPDALYEPDTAPTPDQARATKPDNNKSREHPEACLDKRDLAAAAQALEKSPVGKEDAFFNPLDYLTKEQRKATLAYLEELARMEEYRKPGAVNILSKLKDGYWLSQDEQSQFLIYLRSWDIFLGQ